MDANDQLFDSRKANCRFTKFIRYECINNESILLSHSLRYTCNRYEAVWMLLFGILQHHRLQCELVIYAILSFSLACAVAATLPLLYAEITKGDPTLGRRCSEWMVSTLIKRYNVSLLVAVFDGSWWARMSAQIYLKEDDFVLLGRKLVLLCEDVRARDWLSTVA